MDKKQLEFKLAAMEYCVNEEKRYSARLHEEYTKLGAENENLKLEISILRQFDINAPRK